MARMALTFGACPVCGDHVPRTLQMAAGLQKEIFHCEQHGRLPYSPQHVPLDALALAGGPAAAAGSFLQVGGPGLGGQPGTGIELVC